MCAQPDGEECACPLLLRMMISQMTTTCVTETCPCDEGSDDCAEGLVSMQSDLLPAQEIPPCPPAREMDLSLLGFTTITPIPSVSQNATLLALQVPAPFSPPGNLEISTIVMRL